MNIKHILERVVELAEKLSSKPQIGGLQISDSSLQYLRIGRKAQSASLRLTPGIVREGKIEDAEKLQASLQELHASLDSERKEHAMPVVVSLPPSIVYTQSFTVPNLGEEKLDEAAQLNLQMISPLPQGGAYMSWQRIGSSEDRFELLGAFAEKALIDSYHSLLEKAHFSPVAFEFPGLAFGRLVNSVMQPSEDPVVVFQISSDGINLSIIRNGSLYFDYFRSWSSIQGENRTIPRSLFEEVIEQELRKVINFSLSKFRLTPQRIFLVTPGLEQDMQTFLGSRFDISAVPLELKSFPVTSHWYVALGSALRGRIKRSRDRFVSLAPVSARGLYREEQTLHFIHIWRNVFASVLAIFAVFYAGVAYFLEGEVQGLTQHLSLLRGESYEVELQSLDSQALEFNALVATTQAGRASFDVWITLFDRIKVLGNPANILIDRVEVSRIRERITVSAHAPSNDAVIQFKNALVDASDFDTVDLPVSRITKEEDQSVSFIISFLFKG